MKPQIIDCGSKCKSCDGYGVMTLYGGMTITAPCFICSPGKTLTECEAIRDAAFYSFEKTKELKLIDEHNKRIGASNDR